jgi:hypothetical protein
MRPLKHGLVACALGAFMFALLGCGKGNDDDDTPSKRKRGGGGGGDGSSEVQLEPVKGDYTGKIRGKVVWTAGPVDPPPLDFTKDKDACSMGSEYEKRDNSLWLNKGHTRLGNVFVWIDPPEGQFFDVPKEQLDKVKKTVRVQQPYCAFLPHCSILFPAYYKKGKAAPEKTGQVLLISNDANVAHNANVNSQASGSRNILLGAMAPGKPPQSEKFELKPDKKEITLSCGVHPWMKGFARSFSHPYAALSKVGEDPKEQDPHKKVWQNPEAADFGEYLIEGVPVGATVTIRAWHETRGFLAEKTIKLEADNVQDFEAK